jgi:hypothetical protein
MQLAIRSAESGRGGSLSAMSPASFIAAGGPAATANTRNPCTSSAFATAAASVNAGANAATTEKAFLRRALERHPAP